MVRILRDMIWTRTASRKKFFVLNAGRTNEAHQSLVERLKDCDHVEVFSVKDCDYCLAFCPIASRVGTDVGEALDRIPRDKPTVLVVMHHTFDQDHTVADSSRLVNQPNVQLTVDVLFYRDKLLDSKHNDIAWSEIQRSLGLPDPQVPFMWKIINWAKEHLIVPGVSFLFQAAYTFPLMCWRIVVLPITYMTKPKAKTSLTEGK